MFRADAITLIKKHRSVDEYGDIISTEERREVFCEVKSVGYREKYEALNANLNPEFTFILKDEAEYRGEDIAEYRGTAYRVIRTYIKDFGIELTVAKDGSTE